MLRVGQTRRGLKNGIRFFDQRTFPLLKHLMDVKQWKFTWFSERQAGFESGLNSLPENNCLFVSSFYNTSPNIYSNLEKYISPQKCFQVPFFLVCKSHTQPTIHHVKAGPAVVRKVLGELDAAEFAKVSEHTVVTRASHVTRLGLGGWNDSSRVGM